MPVRAGRSLANLDQDLAMDLAQDLKEDQVLDHGGGGQTLDLAIGVYRYYIHGNLFQPLSSERSKNVIENTVKSKYAWVLQVVFHRPLHGCSQKC